MSNPIWLIINGRQVAPRTPPRLQGDVPMIPLRFTVEAFGGEVDWIPERGASQFSWRDHVGEVAVESGLAQISGHPYVLEPAPRLYDDALFVPASFLARAMGLVATWEPEAAIISLMAPDSHLSGKHLVLDPGHGGTDPGAAGPAGTLEASVTLDIALRLASLLRSAGAVPELTRDGDHHVGLAERVDLVRKTKAGALLSIHCNSYIEPQPHGTETYYYETWQGMKLATAIQRELVEELQLPDRGVREAAFYVLRHTSVPAALAEVSFISNPSEEEMLHDERFRARVAVALFRGVRAYLESAAARIAEA